jgi:NADH-quinone oxidoreductase subunit M
MPLLNGFIGEFTILRGVFEVRWQWAAWGVLGVVLGAAYLLWLYQRVMFGPITNPLNENLPDLNAREWATLLPLILLAFWIGIYPAPMFHVLEAPVERLVRTVNPSYFPPAVPAALMDAPLLPPMAEAVPVPTPARPKSASTAAPSKLEVK